MADHENEHAHHHIVPIPVYVAIFATLLILTGVTVGVAYIDLGRLNIFVALAIAVFKASLVVLYFMHVKYSSRLTQLAAATGFLWLGILLSFTLADEWTRDWQPIRGWAPQPEDAGTLTTPREAGETAGEASSH